MSYGDGGTYVVLANNLKQGLDQLVAQGKATGTNTGTTAGHRDQSAQPGHSHRR